MKLKFHTIKNKKSSLVLLSNKLSSKVHSFQSAFYTDHFIIRIWDLCFVLFWDWYANSVNIMEVLNFILSYSLHLYCRIPFPPTDTCRFALKNKVYTCNNIWKIKYLYVYIISFSAIQIYDLFYIYLHSSPSTGITRTHKVTSLQLAW